MLVSEETTAAVVSKLPLGHPRQRDNLPYHKIVYRSKVVIQSESLV